jgi:perosamine synthetase
VGESEIEAVVRVLRSGELSMGPRIGEFEAAFAKYIGTKYAVAVNSGTSALHLCIRALKIGAKDEVITTSFSFVASANCILYERAMPVFADIDPNSFNVDPPEIRRFLEDSCGPDPCTGLPVDKENGRTVRAILPVHVFGLPCNMDAILELAEEYNLQVIEDACEALGSKYRGQHAGTLGHAAVFAFYPNKQMTTAEGGMVVTDDEEMARDCRSLRNQGRSETSSWLEHEQLGFNYRLSELHCALGLAQLERIDELLIGRKRAADLYNHLLTDHLNYSLPVAIPDSYRSWFVYVIRLRGIDSSLLRDRVLSELRKLDIGCQSYFPAIHRQPYFKQKGIARWLSLPHTEAVSDGCIALPMFSTITEDQIRYVCESLAEVLDTHIPRAILSHAMPF